METPNRKTFTPQLSNASSVAYENLSEISDDERRKRVALEQADAVLEAVGGDYHLDGFNLLGVTANPRGTSFMSSSFHGRYNQSPSTHGAASPANSTSNSVIASDVFSDTYHSLEVGLTQITDQMGAINIMLEDWSKQILESADDYNAEELPESQLRELPEEMRNLNLLSLKDYLEHSGVVAHAFERIIYRNRQPQQQQGEQVVVSDHFDEEESVGTEIPEIFFQMDLDLTDPKTFSELLIANNASSSFNGSTFDLEDDGRPISEWFPLLSPDAFGSSLDKVELALMHQVRSKAGDFFAESVRFAQLQELIEVLLQQVVHLKATCEHLQTDLLDPMDAVPAADQQRVDLRRLLTVLELTEDMLLCKSSLVGVLSAQDDLTAIEQIKYGRRLLAGTAHDNNNNDDNKEDLGRLSSLKAVAQQLNQYEQLVVTNLRDELVEIFLGWNTAAVATVYATNGSSKSTQHVRDRVGEIVGALKSCRGLVKTREAYSSRLQDMIRMTVRTTVGEFASDVASDATSAMASVSIGATAMSLTRFLDCLDMLFEQLLGLLTSAAGVDEFCSKENFFFGDDDENDTQQQDKKKSAQPSGSAPASPMRVVVAAAAELSSKSVSELLRLRKEAHSLVTLEEMKAIWDSCLQFTITIEKMSGKASTLRSTLLAQAKAFVERKHESNMSALVAALDSERWTQCEVSAERQDALTRLCSGRSLISSTGRRANGGAAATAEDAVKSPEAEVEGTRYKVVWSCLLLMEMVTTNIAAAAQFPSLASGIVGKIAEQLRLFNSRTTHLVLGAGAIHSNAKLKSINAKHLSLVTQCLGMVIAILPHVRAALMAQMPKKQHTLLNDLDQTRREFGDHNENVLNKFVTIIGGIVEHGLAPKIAGTDFDARVGAGPFTCCVFLDGVATNTKKMHQVLKTLLPPEHLRDVFSRIFAFVDRKIPALLISASENEDSGFGFPETDDGKKRLLMEMEAMILALNGLEGVLPWDFTAVNVLERRLDVRLHVENDENKGGEKSPPEQSEGASTSGSNGVTPENKEAEETTRGASEEEGEVEPTESKTPESTATT
jgi:vacuolar protein sorting-associated protein 54